MTCAITVEGLTKTFGANRGISDLHFDVRQGEVFGFLGPNGAGKSTTIRLLLGLYRPTAGVAKVLGCDPMHDPVTIHRQTGYLPGELALHPRLTGRQHIDFVAHARGMHDRTLIDQLVERFAVILADPPYVPTAEVAGFDDPVTAIDGGSDGLDLAWRCMQVADEHLEPDGLLSVQLRGRSQAAALLALYRGSTRRRLEPAGVRAWGSDRAVAHYRARPQCPSTGWGT